MSKYIFVTGGVISSLGKGIVSSSIGCLLESRGLSVAMQKIDPYLNVDPGTMSPFQHGEVFVTDDGTETDLDLGHYERFTHIRTSKTSNFTAGQIYNSIIQKERNGDFLGKTVQVVPHVTDEIKDFMKRPAAVTDCDVVIIELGGTVGDIESLPFLEAMRQFPHDVGRSNCMHVHVSLVPYIDTAGEVKTKPTQHSVARMREIGIQPDLLLCRSQKRFSTEATEKLALFCNVDEDAVIQAPDVEYVYELPVIFQEQGLDQQIIKHLGLKCRSDDLTEWKKMLKILTDPEEETKITIVGKYVELRDAYKSINEALVHGGIANNCRANIRWVEAEDVTKQGPDSILGDTNGILIPGGFGERGIEGKITAVGYAREKKVPFLGICLGMQCAVIDFARNICGMEKANSSEFDSNTPHPVIDFLPEQKDITAKGGTMRLGNYLCALEAGSSAAKAYGKSEIMERHRHRYEFNNEYRDTLREKGLKTTGICPERDLVEIVELSDHPWFVGCQFHPEFKSRPHEPHPLFIQFVKAAMELRR